LDRNDAALLDRTRTPAFRAELAAWEEKARPTTNAWMPLDLATVESLQGSKLTRQDDGSVRSEGPRPEKDNYRVGARLRQAAVTAIGREVLTAPGLPHQGPGRQDNGNLHLSEFRLSVGGRDLKIRSAAADYDQPGWTAAHAIDGNPATAWGIYPQVGRP